MLTVPSQMAAVVAAAAAPKKVDDLEMLQEDDEFEVRQLYYTGA